MTWRAEAPRRANRRTWTAYERARDGVGFDYDACSDREGYGLLLNHPTDWDDLTILSGLGSTASESDTK